MTATKPQQPSRKRKRSYTGLKADLDAANREVGDVMQQNKLLKEQAAQSHANGYFLGMQIARQLQVIVQAQSAIIDCYFSQYRTDKR